MVEAEEMKVKFTCTALPPSRQPTGSILKAVVVKPHLQEVANQKPITTHDEDNKIAPE